MTTASTVTAAAASQRRTCLCFYRQMGTCHNGDQFSFAHSEQELQADHSAACPRRSSNRGRANSGSPLTGATVDSAPRVRPVREGVGNRLMAV